MTILPKSETPIPADAKPLSKEEYVRLMREKGFTFSKEDVVENRKV